MNKRLISLIFTSFLLISCGGESKKQIKELKASGYETHHTDIQLAYLNSENYQDTTPYVGNLSKSAPNPTHLSWETEANNVTIHIYEGNDTTKEVVSYQVSEKEFDFYNTKLGQEYTITVSDDEGKEETSEPIHFITGDRGPRNLFIDGVENVRDLAGWGNMKQGMIYRSGRFNADKKDIEVTVTEKGIYELNNHLKIKTEIDLRRTSNNEVGGLTDKSVLGDHVKYIQIPMYYGGNNILTFKGKASGDTYQYDNPAAIATFFEVLADENNYPIDFHCSIGKDRTGCLSYLIEGLMGNSEELLMRDYMFTNFADAGYCKPNEINDRYGKTINQYDLGDSLQEKIYNYLNNEVGVPTDTLDKVINILKA